MLLHDSDRLYLELAKTGSPSDFDGTVGVTALMRDFKAGAY